MLTGAVIRRQRCLRSWTWQNNTFNDHYLEVDYDLSDVLFVTTANTLRIPAAAFGPYGSDSISGYTEDEKVEIAKQHLISKQIKSHGLKKGEWSSLMTHYAI